MLYAEDWHNGGQQLDGTINYILYRGSLNVTRQVALPPTLAPRLIGREAAAAYVSVSPNTFEKMVANGRMPRAKLLGNRRKAWDVRELDKAVDQLPDEADGGTADETWGDVDAS